MARTTASGISATHATDYPLLRRTRAVELPATRPPTPNGWALNHFRPTRRFAEHPLVHDSGDGTPAPTLAQSARTPRTDRAAPPSTAYRNDADRSRTPPPAAVPVPLLSRPTPRSPREDPSHTAGNPGPAGAKLQRRHGYAFQPISAGTQPTARTRTCCRLGIQCRDFVSRITLSARPAVRPHYIRQLDVLASLYPARCPGAPRTSNNHALRSPLPREDCAAHAGCLRRDTRATAAPSPDCPDPTDGAKAA